MFEEDLLDEEIKKKKRRVLVVLFAFLLFGSLAALPMTKLVAPSPTTIAQGTVTATVTSTPTIAPTPTIEIASATPTLQEATSTPTSPATPTATEKTPSSGIGGGTPTTPSPPVTGQETSVAQETQTPATEVGEATSGAQADEETPSPNDLATETATMGPPSELPVTGNTSGIMSSWFAIGLVVLLLGAGVAALRRDPRPRGY